MLVMTGAAEAIVVNEVPATSIVRKPLHSPNMSTISVTVPEGDVMHAWLEVNVSAVNNTVLRISYLENDDEAVLSYRAIGNASRLLKINITYVLQCAQQEEIERVAILMAAFFNSEPVEFEYEVLPGTSINARLCLLESERNSALAEKYNVNAITHDESPDDRRRASIRAYPNPFNPTINIQFYMPADDNVRVEIYDVQGKIVHVLYNGLCPAGEQILKWSGLDSSGREVASGVYFYRLTSNKLTRTGKMALLK